ncbi:phenol hydroxylase [Pseudoxanthomonas kalamensis DSM 18571]|uniref:aromatic/alkene monooxygenase hydroxylase subunit beta n=1 Tax=Pseudoxanthomonas kalamensis TaxID=289483 RepID=UPI001390825D|nr:aromatic/alkene monooxygenase hydroxylase subunit beta [Pseudoxanthomonas kalamensis]KAF1711479.1 phenol hydroxylase [Pseudoxanthomonas kalamensis DSM 18571]
MQIDLRTVAIQPVRQTYDHLARRFGDKPASRYQEGSYDVQVVENMHYRPTWDPDQELYDPTLSRVRMKDWYAIRDPRQFYYSTYTLARARQQENTEANFAFVESRGLVEMLPDEILALTLQLLVPLRHAAWGANLNNTFVCGYGYGTTFTQPCNYQAMDDLGIAQYLSRIGLLLGDVKALDEGKRAWMQDPAWQGLRRYVEDTLVVRDPVENFIAQNLALDGLLYPLVYQRIVDQEIASRGGQAVAMLTSFMRDWFEETRKWVDSVVKTMAAESDENRSALEEWSGHWSGRAASALLPITAIALGSEADDALAETFDAFKMRLSKAGISI